MFHLQFVFGIRFAPILISVCLLSGCGIEDGPVEYRELSGVDAKKRIEIRWPKSVNVEDVVSVDFKTQVALDSYSTWYRIQLNEVAAEAWAAEAHQFERDERFNGDKPIEGVGRAISGPPRLRRQTDTTPKWWTPPKIEFTATELMIWYTDYPSGVARAFYSGFDNSTETLWIYNYACQHDRLWKRGDLPDGERIDFSKQE